MEKGSKHRTMTTKTFLPLLSTTNNASPKAQQIFFSNASQPSLSTRSTFAEPPIITPGMSVPCNAILTPPATPNKNEVERKRSSIGADSAKLVAAPTEELKSMLSVGVGLGVNPTQMVEHMVENGMDVGPLSEVPQTAKPFKKTYKLHGELGYGAWSTVYSAFEVSENLQFGGAMPPTPPRTPEGPSRRGSQKQMLAVKALARRDGKMILEQEARVLTYLHSYSRARHYLVPFYGFDDIRCAIFMCAVPLSLDSHVKTTSKASKSIATMFDPIIGSAQWTTLAVSLINGLIFLQDMNCVHGDIKPANILLQPDNSNKELTPLYTDFSSSHVLSSSDIPDSVEDVNAVTTDFTAPELLRALRHRDSSGGARAIATFSSDLFALAVTLLFAAIGESPYSLARMELQKVGMAAEGRPLDYARCGSNASRVMKGRAVERALSGAVQADAEKRLEAGEWQGIMRDIVTKWEKEGWKDGGRPS